jgi:hypothetical protein
MKFISNLLNLKRRQEPRLAVKWWVDVQVPKTENYVGFLTRDISLPGVRLEGETSEAFKRMICEDGQVHMRLRIPGHQEALAVRAELKWGLGKAGDFLTGWKFIRMPRQARGALRNYIASHPEEAVQVPR